MRIWTKKSRPEINFLVVAQKSYSQVMHELYPIRSRRIQEKLEHNSNIRTKKPVFSARNSISSASNRAWQHSLFAAQKHLFLSASIFWDSSAQSVGGLSSSSCTRSMHACVNVGEFLCLLLSFSPRSIQPPFELIPTVWKYWRDRGDCRKKNVRIWMCQKLKLSEFESFWKIKLAEFESIGKLKLSIFENVGN